jgi:hypothetical protein
MDGGRMGKEIVVGQRWSRWNDEVDVLDTGMHVARNGGGGGSVSFGLA